MDRWFEVIYFLSMDSNRFDNITQQVLRQLDEHTYVQTPSLFIPVQIYFQKKSLEYEDPIVQSISVIASAVSDD